METKQKQQFPYKTLIWAIFATLATIVFRPELKILLTNTEELSLFGVEIKASGEKAERLQDSIRNFEATVASLSSELANQQNKINDLDQLKMQLEEDLAACPDAVETSNQLSSQVTKIFNTNRDLQIKSDKLMRADILKNSFYNVKLVVPSKMVNSDVFVDGKQATIVDKSGIFITVRVAIKKSSHRFELKRGIRKCATSKLITKNGMEVPMECNF